MGPGGGGMIWGNLKDSRVKATPKKKATCPICKGELVSKCGDVMQWHWAHKSKEDCDSWYEPESNWHRNWKDLFPEECQEVTVGKHRADIKFPSGFVIELQNSSISSGDICNREEFYGENMIWILNGKTLAKGLNLRKKELIQTDKQIGLNGEIVKSIGRVKQIVTFRWKSPPKSWWSAKRNIYIDLGDNIFKIKKIHHNIPCGGWGELMDDMEFISRLK